MTGCFFLCATFLTRPSSYLAPMSTVPFYQFLLFGGILHLAAACQSDLHTPLENITDPQVRQVLECAFNQSGTWARFSRLQSIVYTKRSLLLDSLGNTESDITELHDFTFGNNPVFRITRVHGKGDSTVYLAKGRHFEKWVNGRPATVDSAALKNKMNTALYTLLMPWKLLDEGTTLKYAGTDTLPGVGACHVLEAVYAEGEPWRYYFDQKNCKYKAAWASHGAFGALVVNDSTTTISGLTLNTHRTTYRTWQKQKPLWRRAVFYYEILSLD